MFSPQEKEKHDKTTILLYSLYTMPLKVSRQEKLDFLDKSLYTRQEKMYELERLAENYREIDYYEHMCQF